MTRFALNHDPLLWDTPSHLRKRDVNDPSRELSMFKRLLSPSYLNDANSGNPEAVMKIVSTGMGKQSLAQLTAYIARSAEYMDDEDPLTLEDEIGNIIKNEKGTVDDWVEDFEPLASYKDQLWKLKLKNKLEFERAQLQYDGSDDKRLREVNLALKREKTRDDNGNEVNFHFHAPKDITHIIFSVGGDNHNVKHATEATRRFLRDNFEAQGYRYMFLAHNDTENLHFHVILKNKNMIDGKRVQFDKADLFTLRHDYAYHLKQMGIKRVATLRRDRVITLKSIKAQKEELFVRHEIFKEKYAENKPINVQKYRDTLEKKLIRLQAITERELKYSKLTPTRSKELQANLEELKVFKRQFKQESKNIAPDRQGNETRISTWQLQNEAKKLKARKPTSKRQRRHMKKYLQHFEKEVNAAIRHFKAVGKVTKTDTSKSIKQLKDIKKALNLGVGLKLRI
tara:strand:- start:2055 stop:3416 length:1362 start_codon:yes stop_codon:yes gene_type:complete